MLSPLQLIASSCHFPFLCSSLSLSSRTPFINVSSSDHLPPPFFFSFSLPPFLFPSPAPIFSRKPFSTSLFVLGGWHHRPTTTMALASSTATCPMQLLLQEASPPVQMSSSGCSKSGGKAQNKYKENKTQKRGSTDSPLLCFTNHSIMVFGKVHHHQSFLQALCILAIETNLQICSQQVWRTHSSRLPFKLKFYSTGWFLRRSSTSSGTKSQP